VLVVVLVLDQSAWGVSGNEDRCHKRSLGLFLCPEGATGIQPGVSTPGTVPPRRRAPKGRKIERDNNI
jgi:hypothetical protein